MRFILKYVLAITVAGSINGCHAQPLSKNSGLNGVWAITFNSNDIGLVRTAMTFEFGDSTFVGHSREGADRDILGFWKSKLGRIFTSDFEQGALLHVTKGKLTRKGDTLVLSAIFRSAMGNYYYKGTIIDSLMRATLSNGRKEIKGYINGAKGSPKMPIANYPDLISRALQVTENKIFDPKVCRSGEWKNFEKEIKGVSARVQDDLEMIFAFYYFRSKLPFSHYTLTRLSPEEPNSSNKSEVPERQIVLEERSPETAFMKIRSFVGSAQEMDSVFEVICSRSYKNLVVDLRNNSGGNVAPGMRFAQHLADTAFFGGVFLTHKWFESNNGPPALKDYAKLPHFTDSNFDLIIKGIHNEKGLCLKIVPTQPVFKGHLFILTNEVTASTCEPIVYGFKQNGRAVIVGEKTAGAMLNGEPFQLEEGFSLFIPTGDYYAADGYHIDRRGVAPTYAVKAVNADEYVMEKLIKKQP